MLSIGSHVSRVATNGDPLGRRRPEIRFPGTISPERPPRGDIPKGGIAERFRIDVLEKSGRWAMGQRAARGRPLGRQPRRWRTEPAWAGSATSRLRGALAARSGPLSARAAGRV